MLGFVDMVYQQNISKLGWTINAFKKNWTFKSCPVSDLKMLVTTKTNHFGTPFVDFFKEIIKSVKIQIVLKRHSN